MKNATFYRFKNSYESMHIFARINRYYKNLSQYFHNFLVKKYLTQLKSIDHSADLLGGGGGSNIMNNMKQPQQIINFQHSKSIHETI